MVKKLGTGVLFAVITLFVAHGAQSHNKAVPTTQADGGHPILPWPGQSNRIQSLVVASRTGTLVADGGHPIPPWPPSSGFAI